MGFAIACNGQQLQIVLSDLGTFPGPKIAVTWEPDFKPTNACIVLDVHLMLLLLIFQTS